MRHYQNRALTAKFLESKEAALIAEAGANINRFFLNGTNTQGKEENGYVLSIQQKMYQMDLEEQSRHAFTVYYEVYYLGDISKRRRDWAISIEASFNEGNYRLTVGLPNDKEGISKFLVDCSTVFTALKFDFLD